MKVIHFTSVHPPTDRRVLYKQAVSLAESGHDVTLIVAWNEELPPIIRGVRLVRVSRCTSKIARPFVTCLLVTRAVLRTRGDVYHFHDPELIPWAVILKLSGRTVVMDVHEDYPAQVAGMYWIPAPLRPSVARTVGWLEDRAARVFDAVVTADQKLEERFRAVGPHVRVASVQNFPIIRNRMVSNEETVGEIPLVLHLGGINVGRCAEPFMRALERLLDLHFEYRIGGNHNDPALMERLSNSPAWRESAWVGRIPPAHVDELTMSATVSVNLYSKHPNHYGLRSNRLFEALAAGVPVLVSDFPRVREFIEGTRCGIAVDPDNIEEIAGALRWFIENPIEAAEMGRRGRAVVESEFNWSREVQKLLRVYDEVTNSHG